MMRATAAADVGAVWELPAAPCVASSVTRNTSNNGGAATRFELVAVLLVVVVAGVAIVAVRLVDEV